MQGRTTAVCLTVFETILLRARCLFNTSSTIHMAFRFCYSLFVVLIQITRATVVGWWCVCVIGALLLLVQVIDIAIGLCWYVGLWLASCSCRWCIPIGWSMSRGGNLALTSGQLLEKKFTIGWESINTCRLLYVHIVGLSQSDRRDINAYHYHTKPI